MSQSINPISPAVSVPMRSAAVPRPEAATAVQATPPPLASAAPNPKLFLDQATGLVVIELRGQAGEPGTSLPTPRELSAYKRAILSGDELPKSVGTAVGSREPEIPGPGK